MKSIIKTIVATFIGFILINSTIVFAQNVKDKTLYKWQDSSGRWHYSKVPPADTDNTTKKLEIAKETKILIFAEQKDHESQQAKEETIVEMKLRQQRVTCQTTPAAMMETALYLHKIADKNFQEKNITIEEYNQEKLSITKLEEIGSDITFYDHCMDGFSKKPHIKAISNCIMEESSLEKRADCLKGLP